MRESLSLGTAASPCEQCQHPGRHLAECSRWHAQAGRRLQGQRPHCASTFGMQVTNPIRLYSAGRSRWHSQARRRAQGQRHTMPAPSECRTFDPIRISLLTLACPGRTQRAGAPLLPALRQPPRRAAGTPCPARMQGTAAPGPARAPAPIGRRSPGAARCRRRSWATAHRCLHPSRRTGPAAASGGCLAGSRRRCCYCRRVAGSAAAAHWAVAAGCRRG